MSNDALYAPGSHVAGAEILRVADTHRWLRHTTYEVRWDCCGKEKEISHLSIARRVREKRRECKQCSLRKHGAEMGKKNRHEDTPPSPPPGFSIRVPAPGLSGVWMHLGKLGPR